MTSKDTPTTAPAAEPVSTEERSAERLKFFTDAVVAIAMTLLVLPILESVAEAAKEGHDTLEFLSDHAGQLSSFVISFVVIASFWVTHHQLFEHVSRYTGRLMWLNIGWMVTIVWLPVPTAMVGSMETDLAQACLYIGTMWLGSALMLAMNLLVRKHPETWVAEHPPTAGGQAAAGALLLLMTLAWLVGMVLPDHQRYLAMFLLILTGVTQKLLVKVTRPKAVPKPDAG